MFRSLLVTVLAVVAAVSGLEVHAQSAVMYGIADASAGRTKPVGGDSQWRLNSGDMTQSFLGLRGAEDLGGGMQAVWKLESYVNLDTGTDGRYKNDLFWSREAYVGLSGDFGTTVLGRNVTPLYNATVSFNPFGESNVFSPSARHYFGNSGVGGAILGDRTWSNSIAYNNSATRSPFRIAVIGNAEEQSPGSRSTGRNYGGSIAYITGPFAATIAVEHIKNSDLFLPAGFDRQTAYQAGATYDFKFVRLYGQIGRVKTESDVDTTVVLYQLGAAIPFGSSLVLLSYGSAQTKTPFSQTTDRIGSVGYDYFLSKHTDVYVAASYETTYKLSSGNSVATGVRVRF